MPEGLALFDRLYAHEFLTFNARMYGLDEATTRRRVGDLLSLLDLDAACRTPMVAFSSGMRKRVAFAAAIIHRPELLFLDEPFVNLDPGTAAMMKDWLRDFVAKGRAVLMTSHALESMERLCDEVAIIAEGRLAWRGRMARVIGGEPLLWNGCPVDSLEELYLRVVGRQDGRLKWL